MHMLVAENGRMAIHSMCGLCTYYNKRKGPGFLPGMEPVLLQNECYDD